MSYTKIKLDPSTLPQDRQEVEVILWNGRKYKANYRSKSQFFITDNGNAFLAFEVEKWIAL